MFPIEIDEINSIYLTLESHYVNKLMKETGSSNDIGVGISEKQETPRSSPIIPRTIQGWKYFWENILLEEGIVPFLTKYPSPKSDRQHL